MGHFIRKAHCEYGGAWTFVLACKSYDCRSNWYTNPGRIELAIQQRILPSKSKNPLLSQFDGATMSTYQVPKKAVETIYCQKKPVPVECLMGKGYDPEIPLFTSESFEIVKSSDLVRVKTKVDIPQMSYIVAGDLFHIPQNVQSLISKHSDVNQTSIKKSHPLEKLVSSNSVDDLFVYSGPPSLIRKSLDGTGNIEPLGSLLSKSSPDDVKHRGIFNAFSPSVGRHLPHFSSGYLLTLRDILKGEELLLSSY